MTPACFRIFSFARCGFYPAGKGSNAALAIQGCSRNHLGRCELAEGCFQLKRDGIRFLAPQDAFNPLAGDSKLA
jgi:hypothetical protein